MPIRIYNSLSKEKEELVPLDGKTVKMYACGVTVYDKCHIGHARSLYIFDVMRQYLKYRGYDVRFVRNITDVDDKIIHRAKELNKPFDAVVTENIAAYERDLKSLGIGKADSEPRATRYIPQIIGCIENLIRTDFAYNVDGDVYFSVRKFKGYGKLSGQSVDQMIEAARIEQDEKKKDPLDFALWKKAKEGERSWPSPWGAGRPGWHIECSCMSMNELQSNTIDIHAGGRDLIFPHHENEIAQSEALTGKPFAKYWVHHGLLTINGQKMAKSLGNFITVDEVLKKYPADILKMLFLQSHYASPVDFSWEKIADIEKKKKSFYDFFDKVKNWQLCKGNKKPAVSEQEMNKIDQIALRFQTTMDDDFNTPGALACMHELLDLGSRLISVDKEDAFKKVEKLVAKYFKIFGLDIKSTVKISGEVQKLVDQREEARKGKDFKKADALREEMRIKYSTVAVDTAGGITFIKAET
jgi:cysteinyl-tRNA synthetase